MFSFLNSKRKTQKKLRAKIKIKSSPIDRRKLRNASPWEVIEICQFTYVIPLFAIPYQFPTSKNCLNFELNWQFDSSFAVLARVWLGMWVESVESNYIHSIVVWIDFSLLQRNYKWMENRWMEKRGAIKWTFSGARHFIELLFATLTMDIACKSKRRLIVFDFSSRKRVYESNSKDKEKNSREKTFLLVSSTQSFHKQFPSINFLSCFLSNGKFVLQIAFQLFFSVKLNPINSFFIFRFRLSRWHAVKTNTNRKASKKMTIAGTMCEYGYRITMQ